MNAKHMTFLPVLALLAFQVGAQTLGTSQWPYYSEVNPGKWTMNYEDALAASEVDGRDVILLFTGSTWCPYCKSMEEKVFSSTAWTNAVADKYLVQLDYDRRTPNGGTLFAKAEYYAEVAGLTLQEATDRLAVNNALQLQYAVRTDGIVAYPTCVVLRGKAGAPPVRVGRFTSSTVGISGAAAVVIENTLEAVGLCLAADDEENEVNGYTDAVSLPVPELGQTLAHSANLSGMDTDDRYTFTPVTNTALRIVITGTNDTASVSAELSAPGMTTIKTPASTLANGLSIAFLAASEETTYTLKISTTTKTGSTFTPVLDYDVSYTCFEPDIQAFFTVSATSVKKNAGKVNVSVALDTVFTSIPEPVSVTLAAQECVPEDGFKAATANDFQPGEITLTWNPADFKTTKTASITLKNPNSSQWEGDKQFLVKIIDGTGCTPQAGAEVRVSLLETVTRKPGSVAFIGYGPDNTAFASVNSPVLEGISGATQTVWVARLDNADDAISVDVIQGTNVLQTLSWANQNASPKSFTFELPDVPEGTAVVETELKLANPSNGAKLKSARRGTLPVNTYTDKAPQFTGLDATDFTLFTAVDATIPLWYTNAIGGAVSYKILNGRLPSGLKIQTYSNALVISGAPTKAGEAALVVQLITKVKVGTRTVTVVGDTVNITLAVLAYADVAPSLAGKYTAVLLDNSYEDSRVAGLMTITVATSGKITTKTEVEGQTVSTSSSTWTGASTNGTFAFNKSVIKSRVEYIPNLSVAGDTVSGTFASAASGYNYTVEGRRVTWSRTNPATESAGYYTLLLPPNDEKTLIRTGAAITNVPAGFGYLTLTITESTGAAKYSGKLADGTALSGSSFVLAGEDDFFVPVYKPLYSKGGYFGAVVRIQPGATVDANTASLANSNWLYPGKRNFDNMDAFFVIDLDAGYAGGWFTKKQDLAAYYLGKYGFSVPLPDVGFLAPTGVEVALDIDSLTNTLGFVAGSAGTFKIDAKDPDNLAKASINANRTTGLVNGKFSIYYDYVNASGKQTRKTVASPYYGVLIPAGDFAGGLGGAGYYLLPDNTIPYRSFKRSNPVLIQQLTE